MATAFMAFAANRATPEARPRLARYMGWWLLAGVVISYAGYRWWEVALPDSIRALFIGASPALASLAATRHLLLWSLTAALVLGLLCLLALPRTAKVIPLLLIAIASFSFFGGYERLREGVRKPFLIHDFMFSNGVRVDEIQRLNENGFLSKARWAAHRSSGTEHATGRAVFRAQCSSCHTIDGYQAIMPLLPDDPDMTFGVLYMMYEQGEYYADLEPGQTVDKRDLNYPFMPPFVGTEEEIAALAEYLGELATAGPQVAMQTGGAR